MAALIKCGWKKPCHFHSYDLQLLKKKKFPPDENNWPQKRPVLLSKKPCFELDENMRLI